MIENLASREMKKYSQNGEDGILLALLETMPDVPHVAVEFGVGNTLECNTRILKDAGWECHWFDGGGACEGVRQVRLTPENINDEMDAAGVPAELGVLSVDVDGQDYWLWRAFARRAAVVICEYNGYLPLGCYPVTVPRSNDFAWDGSDYFGCSLLAIARLAPTKGVELVYCEKTGTNAFFARGAQPSDPRALYVPQMRTGLLPRHGLGPWQWVNADGEPGELVKMDWLLFSENPKCWQVIHAR